VSQCSSRLPHPQAALHLVRAAGVPERSCALRLLRPRVVVVLLGWPQLLLLPVSVVCASTYNSAAVAAALCAAAQTAVRRRLWAASVAYAYADSAYADSSRELPATRVVSGDPRIFVIRRRHRRRHARRRPSRARSLASPLRLRQGCRWRAERAEHECAARRKCPSASRTARTSVLRLSAQLLSWLILRIVVSRMIAAWHIGTCITNNAGCSKMRRAAPCSGSGSGRCITPLVYHARRIRRR
jgi:hypothetical protein